MAVWSKGHKPELGGTHGRDGPSWHSTTITPIRRTKSGSDVSYTLTQVMDGPTRANDFETAVRPELALLYRVARRMTSSADEAEDLVQQTLIKAFRGWARFDGSFLRSWLLRILRNELAYSMRRHAATIQTTELDDDTGSDCALWDSVAWRDQANRILVALQKLPAEYRLAVLLRDVEEMSYEEAAKAMEVPIGTVRSRVSRGRALIRRRLLGEASARDGSTP